MWFIIKKILAFLWPWHRQKRAWPWRRKLMVILTILAIIASLSLILLWPKSGVGDYGRGNYQAALEKFLNQQVHEPQNKDAAYNAANTYYRLQQNEAAEKIFSSLKDDQDPALAFEAQYNLGDTLYQEGKLGESLEAFEQAAKLNPEDKDTQDNIAFLREEIKKRMQQNQQRQQQQQQQQQQDQQKQQQDQQQQQQQQQQQDNEQGKDQNKDNGQDKDKDKEQSKQGQAGGQNGATPTATASATGGAAMAAAGVTPAASPKMDDQEAARWLDQLDDKRPPVDQKNGPPGTYQDDKDW